MLPSMDQRITKFNRQFGTLSSTLHSFPCFLSIPSFGSFLGVCIYLGLASGSHYSRHIILFNLIPICGVEKIVLQSIILRIHYLVRETVYLHTLS
jgi:hypothetical protein